MSEDGEEDGEEGGSEVAGGPLDVTTLQLRARRADGHPLVASSRFEPDAISPRRLVLILDDRQYPGSVDAARIDIRLYEGGAYSVHYLERRGDRRWECRWDRHRKPGAPTAHVHPPPDAGEPVESSPLQTAHHLEVLFWVLDWTADRVEGLHESVE
ncbi:MAG: hypothetical protein ABEJ42_10020 [Halobacteriaceae archaeon]